ncbi:hypothetical protein ACXYL9_11495 [Qipengyuania sp. CAU 1752]
MKFATLTGAAAALAFATSAFAANPEAATGHEHHDMGEEATADASAEAPEMSPEAKRDAALVTGADVVTYDDQPLGTVSSIDGDNIVLGLEVGPVTFKRDWFMVNEKGALAARMTAEQIDNLLAQAQAAS